MDIAITAFDDDDLDHSLPSGTFRTGHRQDHRGDKAESVSRLQTGTCTIHTASFFRIFLTNYERVSDHCSLIAVAMIEAVQIFLRYPQIFGQAEDDRRSEFKEMFAEVSEKYAIS